MNSVLYFLYSCTVVSSGVADPDPHGPILFWEAGFRSALASKAGSGRFALKKGQNSEALEAENGTRWVCNPDLKGWPVYVDSLSEVENTQRKIAPLSHIHCKTSILSLTPFLSCNVHCALHHAPCFVVLCNSSTSNVMCGLRCY